MFRNHLLVFKPFNDTYGRWNTWQEPKLNLMSSVVLVFDVQRFDRQFHMVGCDLCQIYWDFCFIVLGNLFLNKCCFIDKHQQLIKCYLWVWNLIDDGFYWSLKKVLGLIELFIFYSDVGCDRLMSFIVKSVMLIVLADFYYDSC